MLRSSCNLSRGSGERGCIWYYCFRTIVQLGWDLRIHLTDSLSFGESLSFSQMFAAVLGSSISMYFAQRSKAPYKESFTDKWAKSYISALILLQTSCLILADTLTLSYFISLRTRASQPLRFLPALKLKATSIISEAFLSSLTKKEIYVYIYTFPLVCLLHVGERLHNLDPRMCSNSHNNLMSNIHYMLSAR